MQVNDYVVYNLEGICKIVEEMVPDFATNNRKYFMLIPIANTAARAYVPVDAAEEKCRRLITKEEAEALIKDTANISELEVKNDRERERVYKSALLSKNISSMISLIKLILRRDRERKLTGKKMTSVDEKYLKLAERNICSELGFVLHKSDDEIRNLFLRYAS